MKPLVFTLLFAFSIGMANASGSVASVPSTNFQKKEHKTKIKHHRHHHKHVYKHKHRSK